MATATLRCYAELNDFLPPDRRQRDWPLDFVAPAPVRHLIERAGVPHTEVELILLNGVSVGLETGVTDGDRLAVYPMFEAFDVHRELRLRSAPLRRPRFVADAHLGRLARDLRMLGFDTLWFNDIGDAELVRISVDERRILLSRDRQLLMRQALTHGCFVRPAPTWQQLKALVTRLQLCDAIAPLTRCIACNGVVVATAQAMVRDQVPSGVLGRHDTFWRCSGCGRVYWRGSHWQAMQRRIGAICPHEAGADVDEAAGS